VCTSCLSRQCYVAHSVIFAWLGFLRSSKTSESSSCRSRNHRKLRKGWRRCARGGPRRTMAGIMETNATSRARPAVSLYWRNTVRSEYRLIVCRILRSRSGRWRSSVLATRAFRGSNFADALAVDIFLGFLLRNSWVTQEAHLKEDLSARHVHLLNAIKLKTRSICDHSKYYNNISLLK